MPSSNPPDFGQYERKGRSSLVPFRMSFNSINENPMDQQQRKSDLFNDLNKLDRNSAVFQGCNINFEKMLPFFQGGLGLKSSFTQQDDLPNFGQTTGNNHLESKRSLIIQDSTDLTAQGQAGSRDKQRSSSLPPNKKMQSSNEYYEVKEVVYVQEEDQNTSEQLTRLSVGY